MFLIRDAIYCAARNPGRGDNIENGNQKKKKETGADGKTYIVSQACSLCMGSIYLVPLWSGKGTIGRRVDSFTKKKKRQPLISL